MNLQAYSIFDNKALVYHAPFFAINDGVAVRMLSDLANDLNTNIGRHPSDFSLFRVGVFDDNKGQFTPAFPLVHIFDAIGLVQRTDELPLTGGNGDARVS